MLGAGAWLGLAPQPASGAASGPQVRTDRGCYVVGQRVQVAGAGFAPLRLYDLAIDGVDFGQSETNSAGGFSTSLSAGGLPTNVVQSVDQLDASDGTSDATTTFTLTRPAGALFLDDRGAPRARRAPFEVWGFALGGGRVNVYLHYVSPSGGVARTIALGRTGGQCGYLKTGTRALFPFGAQSGAWTLQFDTSRSYRSRPSGPAARISVRL